MMGFCLLLMMAASQPQAPDWEHWLAGGDAAQVRRMVREHRAAGEKYFFMTLNKLLKARYSGDQETAGDAEKKLALLSTLFVDVLGEGHLRLFLKESRSWDKEGIQAKFTAQRECYLARFLWKSGRRAEALTHVQSAQGICRQLPDTQGYIESHLLQGQYQWETGDGEQAVQSLLKALSKAEPPAYHTAMQRILSPLGAIYLRQSRHGDAEKTFQQMWAVCRRIQDQPGEGWALSCLGQTTLETGRLDQALSFYRQALALPRRARPLDGEIHFGLGKVYSEQRHHLAAFRAYEKALAVAGREKDDELRARVHLGLASLWRRENDFDRAEKAYQEALAAAEKSRKPALVAGIQNNLANVHQIRGNADRARALYEKALAVEEKLGDRIMVGRILTNLALLAWSQEKHGEGEAFFSRALALLKETGDRAAQAELNKERGFAQLSREKHDDAEACFKTAESLFLMLRDCNGLADVQLGFGKVALGRHDAPQACVHFARSIGYLEAQRRKVTSARYRDLFFNREEHAEVFSLYAAVLMGMGRVEAAFAVSEQAKAQGLSAEMLCLEKAREHMPEALRGEQERLASRQSELRRILETARGAAYARAIEEFDANEKAYAILEEKIWAVFPRSKPAEAPSLGALQAALKQGDLLVEYLLGEETSFVFAVSQKSCEVFTLETESRIRAAVEALLAACRTPFSEPAGPAEKAAALLLKPVLDRVQAAQRLLIVPDGVLQGLPFGILHCQGKYLIESVPISYLPSAGIVLHKRKADAPPQKAFVFGDPCYAAERVFDPRLKNGKVAFSRLTASAEEARSVAQILDAQLFLGEAANEAALKSVLPDARYLHLAVHSVVHPDKPGLSAIILSQGDQNDGIMELREVTRTQSELVVLSACKSGLGEDAKGEGFLGFGRGLIEAGAERVVLSYWNVHDACAAEIMPSFWRAFIRRHDADWALRSAKLAFLMRARRGDIPFTAATERSRFQRIEKRQGYDHPFFWGGFVLLSTRL